MFHKISLTLLYSQYCGVWRAAAAPGVSSYLAPGHLAQPQCKQVTGDNNTIHNNNCSDNDNSDAVGDQHGDGGAVHRGHLLHVRPPPGAAPQEAQEEAG